MTQSPLRLVLLLIPLVFACFALSPTAQAVSPAPDGGYPGGNTAEGQNALFSLTSGGFNTAVGFFSLRSNATGQFNTATGAGTLLASTADENTATGAAALLSNTTGPGNTANGAFALFSNTTGGFNTANGDRALSSNTVGAQNTATGISALTSNTGGLRNTGNGAYALANNTTGNDNTANGMFTLFSNTSGNENAANGSQALYSNTLGNDNMANGFQALYSNTGGTANVANGFQALYSNTESFNTAIGWEALRDNTTGSDNTALGFQAGVGVTTAHNVISIGLPGVNVDNSCYIGNIWNQPGGSQAVYVNASGKLGAMVSSRRFKDEITPMEQASEVIYQLKPVSFRYKPEIEPARPLGFGLIAEDVEKINPDLVACDKEGKPYTVRYDQVNAMLLNEFLKEHRKNEEQEKTIAALKSGMTALATTVKEQTAQIQKVSAQLEASKSTPRTVLNGR